MHRNDASSLTHYIVVVVIVVVLVHFLKCSGCTSTRLDADNFVSACSRRTSADANNLALITARELLPLSPSNPLIGVGPDFFGMQNSRGIVCTGFYLRSMSHCLKFVTAGRKRKKERETKIIQVLWAFRESTVFRSALSFARFGPYILPLGYASIITTDRYQLIRPLRERTQSCTLSFYINCCVS